ncbi:MAG TPA: sterol desaturase family protein [Gallionella sp.]|nr:sterol desaturase family protein [Gallionella sp.]
MSQIIIFAIPIFITLTVVEYLYGVLTRRNTYRLNDTISSLSQGLLSQTIAACTPLFQIGLYSMLYQHIPGWGHSNLWETWYGIALAVIIYDFCDYWLHRTSHECNFFWAAHVVHHQSQHFNFSTALRQESAYPIVGCMFFFPMAFLGIPPEIYGTAALVVLLYQFWIHTEHIGKLGWFDRIFASPSNHRVHHSINARYIDKNYGAIFVIWDRLFGTFEPESETCVYGTLVPLNSWNPVKAVSSVFSDMAKKIAHAGSWADKARFIYKYPGWTPSHYLPTTGDTTAQINNRAKYDPSVSKNRAIAAVIFFMLASATTIILIWHEENMSWTNKFLTAVLVAGILWMAGKMISARKIARSELLSI